MTLSPRARELLEAYRQAETPSTKTLDRILDAVSEHPPIVPSPELDVDPQAISAAGPGGSVLAKLGASAGAKVLAATIAVSIPAAWWLSRPGPHAAPVRAPAVASASPRTQGAGTRTGEPASDPAPAPRPLRLSDLPVPAAPPSSARVRPNDSATPLRPAGSAAPAITLDETPAPSASAPGNGTLAEEVTLLARANEALAAGDPRRALALLKEHQARFPTSRLGQVRAVTRALSLCAAGQLAEGRRAAEAILQAQPGSPFAERLRSACGPP